MGMGMLLDGCGEADWRISGSCLEGVGRLSGGCGKAVWQVCEGYM